MILLQKRFVKHVLMLLALLVRSSALGAQVSPTPTVTEGDPNYAYNWTQWLNAQMPQAVPQESVSLGALQWTSLAGIPTGTPGEFGAHMTWTGLSTIKAPSTCSPLVPPSVSVQAVVVPINSYNERYQFLIAPPEPGYSPNGPNTAVHRTQLKVVLSVPTLGGPPELHEATLEPVSNESLFAGAILATIAFHPRTSLPQKLDISWYASDALSQGVGGVQTGPGGNPTTSAPPSEKAEACYTIVPYLKPQLGGFVVPYLPVTIVYQPAGCGTVPNTNPAVIGGSSAVFTTTAQVGTTFSWENLKTSGSIQTDNPADFFEHVKDATDGASFVASLIPGGQPVAEALDKVGKVIDALNKIVPNTKTTITSTSTQGHSETQGWVISSSQGYGTQVCDPEDRYVYMRNVLFVYAVVPKDPVSKQFTPTGIPTVILAPIHFDAPVNADLLSDLQRNVPPDVLAQFVALHAQVPNQVSTGASDQVRLRSGKPGPHSGLGPRVQRPPRLVPWQPGTDNVNINESIWKCYADAPNYVEFGKQSIVSYELSQTSTTTTVKEVTGLIAQLMGQDGTTTQSSTLTGAKNNWLSYGTDSKLTLQCPEIAPNYYAKEMNVWFDTVMGTLLAIPNGKLDTYDQQPQIQGSTSPNTDVVLEIGHKSYRVLSDAQGKYAFKFASIPKGAGVLVAGNQTLPISYNGAPLSNQNFKIDSGVVAGSIPKAIPGGKLGNPVNPTAPCCAVTNIDATNSIVTAKVSNSGQTFQFTVKDSTLFRSLRVGQGVFANFKTRQVSINGIDICCTIVASATTKPGASPTSAGTAASQVSAVQAPPVGACCQITSINDANGIVAAAVNATGQTFQFQASPQLLRSLKTGQPVYANLTTRQVSLDGKAPAGTITTIASLGTLPRGATQPAQSGTPQRANVSAGSIGLHPPQLVATKQIDPCSIPPADPADVLQALLSLGIKSYFPRTMQKGGDHIKLSDPEIEQVTCPNMTLKIKLKIEYRQTRGLAQFQVSGTVEMQSPLIAQVQFQPGPNGSTAVTASNFLHATAVLTDIEITALHLNNVPNWLDNTWIRNCLNGQYSNWGCQDVVQQIRFDISNLVQLYLQQGHTL